MSISQVMHSPRSVDIAITGRCNLDCKYCFYADEMVALGDLPTERWLAFFDELGRLGIIQVTLTGGEVFTRRDLFELIDGLIANRMRYSLLTNGTLITPKVIEQFAVGKRRQRLDSIQVSVDGSCAEIHNQSRPRSFDRAVQALRLLVEAQFPVSVRVTINRHNVTELDQVAHLLLEDIGLPSFTTNEAAPQGSAHHDRGIILTHEQRVYAMEKMRELSERYPGRISAQAGPLAMQSYYRRIEEMIAQGHTTDGVGGYLSGCGCSFSKLSVLHDGTIVPCHLLSGLHMGNIINDDFQDVWLNHEIENAMGTRREIPLSELEACADCP
ncbi:MAG: radical SAM protein [Anaerolineae bacterium]|nr:radical SAM protein [Anaerolineae bacterium]